MPVYLYECANPDCSGGGSFELRQSIHEDSLSICPHCGGVVYRVISPVGLSLPTGDSALKDKGFAKLVRRDKGVYENVTAIGNESRYWHADKPSTMPDIKSRISD